MAKFVPENTIISDATVPINFLEIGEFPVLLKILNGRLHITNLVRGEIRRNRGVLDQAIVDGEVTEHPIPIQEVGHLARSFQNFDAGEASCFVLAKRNSWRVATDDGAAKTFLSKDLGESYVVTTFDILREGVILGHIKKEHAMNLLRDMKSKASFMYNDEVFDEFMKATKDY